MDDTPPEVFLHYLSVSKFDILDSRLVAEWEAKFTIIEDVPDLPPNPITPVYAEDSSFERIEAFVSFKDHVLAVNSTKVVSVWEVPGQTTMSVKFSTMGLEGEDQMEVKDWLLEDIRKDRDNGAVIFGMVMVLWIEGYARSYWAQCSDLRIDFSKPKWVVTWPKDCYVSNWYHPLNSLYR
ncbi:hypothetical protein SO802_030924 [Lithocarpus litseifolius]|uniref:Uncharacterized protein n=1 Tax=Lithocarpus litseifolius TaxID=425828 RepID=A0AAW2BK95_9ROSI